MARIELSDDARTGIEARAVYRQPGKQAELSGDKTGWQPGTAQCQHSVKVSLGLTGSHFARPPQRLG